MIKYFKTLNESLIELNEIQENIWVNMINPTEKEILMVSSSLLADSYAYYISKKTNARPFLDVH